MEKLLKKKVKDFMNKQVIAVREEDPIKKVFQLMDRHGILGVPVVDEKKRVIGIVTETDLIAHFTTLPSPSFINLLGGLVYLDSVDEFNEKLKDHCAETVGELMSGEPIVAREEDTLQEVIDLMAEKRTIRLPVVDRKGVLKGIITRSDIIHQLVKLKLI